VGVSRLKVMSQLDIAERRKPQDGKIAFKRFGPLDVELRIAIHSDSQRHGGVVMRVLAAGKRPSRSTSSASAPRRCNRSSG